MKIRGKSCLILLLVLALLLQPLMLFAAEPQQVEEAPRQITDPGELAQLLEQLSPEEKALFQESDPPEEELPEPVEAVQVEQFGEKPGAEEAEAAWPVGEIQTLEIDDPFAFMVDETRQVLAEEAEPEEPSAAEESVAGNAKGGGKSTQGMKPFGEMSEALLLPEQPEEKAPELKLEPELKTEPVLVDR